MSNEKLEALMWYGYGRDELFARGVFFRKNGINRINVANRAEADDIAETHNTALEKAWDTAHALGVEEGKQEAYAIAAKLAKELTAAKLELERLREAAPVLPASVEALKWTKHAAHDLVVSTRGCTLFAAGSAPARDYAIECHNASIDQAVEFARKEAAPMDDGRRYRLVYADGTADAGDDFSLGSLFTWATALEIVRVFNANPNEADVTAALVPRPVEPKHVHTWSSPFPDGHRICLVDGCNARQVAEWKDAPWPR